VWSPFANFWLYGATANITAAKAAGVRIALGSDWAPSGTATSLREFKVAERTPLKPPQLHLTPGRSLS
jgi:5-methylthioadenosine/S-adenosylhomocysteine deaminase